MPLVFPNKNLLPARQEPPTLAALKDRLIQPPFDWPRRRADGAPEPPAQAFPTVAATNTGTSDVSPQVVALPSGIVSGELLIILLSIRNAPTPTTPTGWTLLYDLNGGGVIRFAAYYKVADGTEGATVGVTLSQAREGASNSYRISGYQGTPEAATTSSAIDPPNLAPSWGSAKTLWLAVAGNIDSSSVGTAPTDFTDLIQLNNGTLACQGSARRELQASSLDPGAFGTAGTAPCSATIAIQPA